MSKGQRTVLPLSLSPANPDAVIVATALKDVAKGQRSAAVLQWAAAYLQGKAREGPAIIAELGISEEELDQLLDDF
jgi:hypothetical protein